MKKTAHHFAEITFIAFVFSLLLCGCQGGSETTEPKKISSNQQKAQQLCNGSSASESNCIAFSEELLLILESQSYLNSGYVKTHDVSEYPSVISIGKDIAVYIDRDNAEDFLKVDPDLRGSNVELAIGSTIIREVWDGPFMSKYTAMIKMEAGYFPEGGDFSYIEVGADGSIISGGKNPVCGACHLHRQNDGFLFGIDAEYRINPNATL